MSCTVVTQFHCIFCMENIAEAFACTLFCIFIHPLMDSSNGSTFGLLCIMSL